MTAPTVDDILTRTHIGGHFHEWGVDGGVIRVSRADLRPVLEDAYDSTDPNWVAYVVIEED